MTEIQINAILDQALRLRENGDLESALREIQLLTKITPQKASVAGILATLFFEGKIWPEAARWYRLATKLNPKAELASLGLFHSLWEMGRQKQAFAEMKRFLLIARSKEYVRLLRELHSETVEDRPLKADLPGFQRVQYLAPQKLSRPERVTFNLGERSGLYWRKKRKFTALRSEELQHA